MVQRPAPPAGSSSSSGPTNGLPTGCQDTDQ
ncbi:Uncharacterised protein [Mycobacteroides abscessus]|nr:Uncharacterised protein [Mycobacteroides abscessus]